MILADCYMLERLIYREIWYMEVFKMKHIISKMNRKIVDLSILLKGVVRYEKLCVCNVFNYNICVIFCGRRGDHFRVI